MSIVTFKVLQLVDPVGHGGKLEVNGVYQGNLQAGIVGYKDFNDREWSFFPGDTCEIIEK